MHARRVLLAAASLAALLVTSSAQAGTRTDSQGYIAVGGDLAVLCPAGNAEGIGGACFALDGTETAATSVTITDLHGQPVGGFYSFSDALSQGEAITSGSFCGSISDLAVPDGAVALFVYVDSALVALDCPPGGLPGTTGTITVEWATSDV